MRIRTLLPLIAPLLATAAAVPAAGQRPYDPTARLDRLVAGRVAGAPQSCIDPRRVRQTEIVSGQAITYRIGDRLFVNRPRLGLEWLDRDNIMISQRPVAQLCRGEPIQLIDRASRIQRGFVTLGDFVPYDRARR